MNKRSVSYLVLECAYWLEADRLGLTMLIPKVRTFCRDVQEVSLALATPERFQG